MKIKILFFTIVRTILYRIVILSAFFSITANMIAQDQNQKVTISGNQLTIKDAFEEVEKQTGMTIAYNESLINVKQTVSVNISNKSLSEALTEILKNTNTTFNIKNKQILIVKKVTQQARKVTGTIVDDNNEPITGVSISEKNTTNGTISDIDGKFSLDVTSSSILSFSFVGFETQEIEVGNNSQFNIRMREDAKLLDEVVVVGYGIQKKSDLTGAIAVVKQKDLPPAANTSVAHMLSGKATGLTATMQSAQPGGGMNLQIRGTASNRSPLIVIDGFPQADFSVPSGGYGSINKDNKVETGLNSINPNDVESIEILKDASATAIYGSRAAGGVILITTKRGKAGKVQVNYKASVTTQHLYGLPNMLGAREFMTEANEVIKEKWMRTNGVYPYGSKTYDEVWNNSGVSKWQPKYSESDIANPANQTDWLDEITRAGFINEHNLSVQGGTESTKYLTSLNYYKQNGVIKTNDLERFNMRINLDQKFSNIISGGVSLNINQVKNRNVPIGGNGYENAGIIRAAQQFNPLIPVRNEKGEYALDPDQGFLANPVSLLDIRDHTTTQRALLLAYVEAQPIKDLTLKAQFGVDRNQGKRDYYMPTTVLFGAREGGYAVQSQNERQDYNVNLVANWHKVINDHDISVMGGYDYQKLTRSNFSAGNSKFPYDGMLWFNLGAGSKDRPDVASGGSTTIMASYIGRLNYVFKNKYMLTANFRADGSSNFAKNHKWGYFPGVSLGWKIHEESFMKGTSGWLSELKLRAGYGQTGNDKFIMNDVEYYTTNPYYGVGTNYIFDGTLNNGIELKFLGNPDLKWETQTDINLGLDFSFMNYRFAGSIEVFDRTISDIIGARDLMSYQEITTRIANLDSEKQTRGLEINFTSRNISNKDFSWTTDATFTYYRDRWKKRDGNWSPNIMSSVKQPFNELWYYKSSGIVSPEDTEYISKYGAIPGTVKILDVDGYLKDSDGKIIVDANGIPQRTGTPDGILDDADKIKFGVNTPYTIGLNNSFTYKGFDLNVYVYGMFNRWKINDTRSYYLTEAYRLENGSNMYNEVVDRWSYKNMDSDLPSIFQVDSKIGTGNYFLEKAWFIRFKNITLGYTFDQSWLKKVCSSARVFVDAQNLFLITPYKGTDPETDALGAYPQQRSISFGVDIKF